MLLFIVEHVGLWLESDLVLSEVDLQISEGRVVIVTLLGALQAVSIHPAVLTRGVGVALDILEFFGQQDLLRFYQILEHPVRDLEGR